MMNGLLPRLAVLGALLGTAFFDLAPAFAQAPPAVPALPDTERRTSYSLTAQTGPFNVNFALYGDSTDYGEWLQVWICTSAVLNPCSALTPVTDWTLSSATGSVATIPRPITDATIALTAARTGTLQILGARRPRRTSQFAENRGVAARDLNQVITDLVAQNRETWDLAQSRTIRGQPGETITALQPASTRAGGILCWDATGLIPQTCAAGSSGTANVVGPNVSVVGHIATYGNTTGTILLDGGLVGAGDFIGPAGATVNHVVTFAGATGKVGKDSGLTLTPSTGTITVTNAKTLAVDNSLEFAGTDSTVMTFPTTSATIARTDAANTFTGHQTIEGVTTTGATGTGKLVFDTAPTLGAITVTSVDKVAITAPATSATLTIADGKTLTDTSGVGANVLLGAAGGGFSAYGGASCTNQFIRALSAAAAATCASVANADLSNSSLTIGSTNIALGATASTVAGLTLTAPTINGGTHQAITNLGIRSTGTGAFDLVLANTENLTAQRTLTLTLNNAPRTLSLSGNITTAADFITAGGNAITLTTTGSTGVTLPTSGTLATRDTAQTFSGANIFSALQQFTDAKFSSGKIYPTADSTTALQVTKADGTTRIVNFDTTNARVGINKTAGAFDLDVNGAVNVGGTLTFTTLDAASLAASPSTITGLTINNVPNSSNDYIPYYNAAANAWRRCTVGSCAASATAGVSSLNGLTGGLSVAVSGAGTSSASGSTVTVTVLDPFSFENCSLAASVGSNILTVAFKDAAGNDPTASSPCRIAFRSATAATGSYSMDSITSANSMNTNATGATLGSTNSTAFRFWVVAFDNGGTVVPALINCSTSTAIFSISDNDIASTTSISGAATSAGVFYTPNGTTLASKAYRILGYVEYGSGLATAGTYASGPTLIQSFGPGVKLPGLVVQAKRTTTTSNTQTASGSYVDTALSLAITPKSAVNLVKYTMSGNFESEFATANGNLTIVRAATSIGNAIQYTAVATNSFTGVSLSDIDSPATSSSVTYKVQIHSDSVHNVDFPTTATGSLGTLVLEEIQG